MFVISPADNKIRWSFRRQPQSQEVSAWHRQSVPKTERWTNTETACQPNGGKTWQVKSPQHTYWLADCEDYLGDRLPGSCRTKCGDGDAERQWHTQTHGHIVRRNESMMSISNLCFLSSEEKMREQHQGHQTLSVKDLKCNLEKNNFTKCLSKKTSFLSCAVGSMSGPSPRQDGEHLIWYYLSEVKL